MKIALIMGALLIATIASSAWYIDRLQDNIGTLKGNQLVLETKIQEQNEAIETALNNQKKAQTLMASLEKEKQEAMRNVNKLRKTFAKHDLDELTLAKPSTTDTHKLVHGRSAHVDENGNGNVLSFMGFHADSVSAITRIQIIPASGNISRGNFTLFGVANS